MEPNARPIRIDETQVDALILDLERQAQKVMVGAPMPVVPKRVNPRTGKTLPPPTVIARQDVRLVFKGHDLREEPIPVNVVLVDRFIDAWAIYSPTWDEVDIYAKMSNIGRLEWPARMRSTLLHELVHAADPSIGKHRHTGRSYKGVPRKILKMAPTHALAYGRRTGVGRIEVRAHMAEVAQRIIPIIETRLGKLAEFGQTITTAEYNDMFRDELAGTKEDWPLFRRSDPAFDKEWAEFVRGVYRAVEDELALWKTDDGRTLKQVAVNDDVKKMSDFDRELAEALSGRRDVGVPQVLLDTYARRHRR